MSTLLRMAYPYQRLSQNCFSLNCLRFSSIIFSISHKQKYCTISSQNPLIGIKELPQFSQVTGDSITEAFPHLFTQTEHQYETFEGDLESKFSVTWDDVVPTSEKIFDPLSLAWKGVQHLHGVKNSVSLREAYQKVLPKYVALGNKISQSKPMYNALKKLEKSKGLEEGQKRIIDSALQSALLSGVHLEGEEKEEFNKIVQELSELGTKFQNNVLDSTKAFSYSIKDSKYLEGLPSSLKTLMALYAGQKTNETADKEKGPWTLTLDMPCFEPFMKYSTNTTLREMLYRSYITRASSDDVDNSNIIERIRELRKKKSKILNFNSFAELSVSRKMAKTPDAVWQMIRELASKAKPFALKELQQLQLFASSHGLNGQLRPWDLSFWSEKQKEHLLRLNEEKLREYFPLPRVLEGMFSLTQEIFDIRIEETHHDNVWHEDVKFFKVYRRKGEHIASFFLDLFSRPSEKQGGAWMFHALDKDDSMGRKPIAYLVCNQSPPVDGVPSLMNFREVTTLFHEFGHGLQHMLTTVKYPAAAGINNIEYDAVELPSQFMENWLYDWTTVQKIAAHYETGEVLPKEIFQQIVKAKNYNAGLANMRQLYFAALDMELHTSDEPWRDVMKRVANEYTVIPPLEEDSFPCSFLHIFSYGYAAGYYSYKWAEVLSADAFSAFEEVGLHNRNEIINLGMRFRDTVLALGGSRHPEQVYIDFRGRKANVSALLKSNGLL